MSDYTEVTEYCAVFNCMSCGFLLSVARSARVTQCENCGAKYAGTGALPAYRCDAGRPPNQWVSNGYAPTPEPTTRPGG